jgi:hypothetical protein
MNSPSICLLLLSFIICVTAVLDPDLTSCPPKPCPSNCPNPPITNPYSAGDIPVVVGANEEYAIPESLISTNVCVDPCVLGSQCCKDWGIQRAGAVTLPDNTQIQCSAVNCSNVCRMLCSSSCPTCADAQTEGIQGEAYIFGRRGKCGPPYVPFFQINPSCPTHVGFGFLVSPSVYMFGAVENALPHKSQIAGLISGLYVAKGGDNGMWMASSSFEQMIQAMQDPCQSCFHGAIGVARYTEYKVTDVSKPNGCKAVSEAESWYGLGYTAGPRYDLTHKSLDSSLRMFGII